MQRDMSRLNAAFWQGRSSVSCTGQQCQLVLQSYTTLLDNPMQPASPGRCTEGSFCQLYLCLCSWYNQISREAIHICSVSSQGRCRKSCSQFKNFGTASPIKICVCETTRIVMSNYIFTKYCLYTSSHLFWSFFFFFHLCVNSEQDKVMTIFIYNITLFSLSCWHSFVIWLPTMQISYSRRNSVVWARDPCHTTHYSQDLRDEQQLSQLCAAHLVWSFKKTRK